MNEPAEIDEELLPILACPETRQSLTVGSAELLEGLNARIAAGSLETVAGEKVSEPLEAVLVREDGRVAYPVRRSIPVLLVEEGLPLSGE